MSLKFNPSFQTDDESVSNFIVRRYQLETIVDELTVSSNALTAPPRFLVPAPRGAGKTTLCRRVVAETRMSPNLSDAWQAIFLGEESYTVTTPGEFFLECLFQLNDQAPSRNLARSHAQATEARSEDELIDLTLGTLENFSKTTGKRLLLVVENFHAILNEQIQDAKISGPRNLVRILDDSPFFGVLATSVTQASDDHGSTLPKHYHRIELPPLSLVECRELWESLTGNEVNEEKLRPLQILTGGSPRLLHILAEFTRTPSLHDLLTNLNYLIDQYTEYFKSQLDSLPTIERKVFVTLLDMWDPSTAKQVAKTARVTTNSASAMLARLTDRGAVSKEIVRGRPAIYVATERLFNIYYLMRRHNHPSSRVRALVSFMMFYYDNDELVDTTASLVREACSFEPTRRGDYHSTFDAIISSSTARVRHQILARTSPDFIQSFQNHYRASHDLTTHFHHDEAKSDENLALQHLIELIEKSAQEGDLEATYRLVMKALQIDGEMTQLWIRLSFLELRRGNVHAAMDASKKARDLNPEDPWSQATLGHVLARAERIDEAEECYLAAIKTDPTHPLAVTELASIREQRGDVLSALTLFEEASRNQGLTDLTRYSYAQLLARVGRPLQAETILSDGADKFENSLSRRALVEMLEADQREHDGIQLLETVAKATDQWEAWADLGRYLSRTSHFSMACGALRNAIDKGGDQISLYAQLARAISERGEDKDAATAVAIELVTRFPERSDAWITAGRIYEILGADTEAEAAYREALNYEDGILALPPLTKLMQGHDNRRRELEELVRSSIASTKGPQKCIPSRELAKLAIHSGDDVQARKAIDIALKANERCVCCITLHGDILRRGGQPSSAEAQYRTALALDETVIAALTGLAQVVVPDEAAALIERAVKADPRDPRVLLARARINSADPEAQVRDIQASIELDSHFVEARLLYASLEANRGNLDAAMEQLDAALTDLPLQRELIPNFVNAAMSATRLDNGVCLTDLLDRHENAITLEPLAVAVQILRGEEPMVAKEIWDVAWDIIMRS